MCVADVTPQDWLRVAQMINTEGGRLISLWGTDRHPLADRYVMSAVYCADEGLLWLRLAVTEREGYPDLSVIFPSAARMQRTVFDLLGIPANGAEDTRPWINHGRWPASYFPLRHEFSGREQFDNGLEEYPFVQVEGDGVHEIAVGPIHAGTIEPGHFRFSVVGEKVLRLEQRLGYTHKGTDKLLVGRELTDGARIAGRVSGDSTVAFAWAYCMAVEGASKCEVPARALWLRALLLERERIANHLGDLGALGNDAGLAFGLAQFSRLKEDWVRLNLQLFGHRFMMDRIIPGGVSVDLDAAGIGLLMTQCDRIEDEVRTLHGIYDEHAGLQDRFISAGRVLPKLASELGLCGMAGRASGQAWDARADQAMAPYSQLDVRMATHRNGDVAARVLVRFDEIAESLRLLREILRRLPSGSIAVSLPASGGESLGTGWVEGWRGTVLVCLETDAHGKVLRCHCHDPSWQNWPVLQHAIMGNIVPDFPLINKSFNLSYSGHDL
ncbi:MAG TPA: NADH-quinone oxidoreductase subunit C [Noviherbaspirillum sp.]|nr:NADH-quinone oxidoreductase subunit C [Noviherbaspirillum sp.]HJV80982.1 NADH-quinone oxidoreductase subunit C [Noviherbaspirillum sp.]